MTAEEIDYLLRFDRPLVEVVKYCPAADTNACIAVELLVQDISSPQEERAEQPRSLRERLQDAIQKVQRPPAAEEMIHDSGAR